MVNQSYDVSTASWEQLLEKVTAHAADLPFLESTRNDLAVALRGTKEAKARQVIFQAQLRQATRDLRESMTRSRELASRLRNGIRMRYGTSNEKLADFEIRPWGPTAQTEK
jgi:hypothetical protein